MNSKCSYLRGERAFCKTSWTLSFKRSTQCQAAIKTTVEQFRARNKYNFDMKAKVSVCSRGDSRSGPERQAQSGHHIRWWCFCGWEVELQDSLDFDNGPKIWKWDSLERRQGNRAEDTRTVCVENAHELVDRPWRGWQVKRRNSASHGHSSWQVAHLLSSSSFYRFCLILLSWGIRKKSPTSFSIQHSVKACYYWPRVGSMNIVFRGS